MSDMKNTWRLLASMCVIVGLPCYVVCMLEHFCTGGHMAHPPYAQWHYVTDALWLTCLVAAAVVSIPSNMLPRMALVATLVLLVLSPVLRMSDVIRSSLTLLVLEHLLVLPAAGLAVAGLFSKSTDYSGQSPEQRRQGHRVERRRMIIAGLATVGIILGARVAWIIYVEIRMGRVRMMTLGLATVGTMLGAIGAWCIYRQMRRKS